MFFVALGLPGPAHQSSLPVPVVANRLKRLHLHQAPANRSKSSGRLNFRSSPGELASSVYSAPGTRSSTSSKTPKSRLNAAQSSCVTPESCSTRQLSFSKPFRQALLPPAFQGRLQLRPALGVLFERNPKGAFFRRANELNIHHVEPMRSGYPFRRLSDFVQTDCHRTFTPANRSRSPGTLFLQPAGQTAPAGSSVSSPPVCIGPPGSLPNSCVHASDSKPVMREKRRVRIPANCPK